MQQKRILLLDVMVSRDGIRVTSVPDKMQVFTEYYKDLYGTQGVEEEKMEEFLDQTKLPSFTEEHRLSLQGFIMTQEI